jgi:hypothetical protein
MALFILLLTIIVLDMAALHWGVDSTDGIHSLEWLRRQRGIVFTSGNEISSTIVRRERGIPQYGSNKKIVD